MARPAFLVLLALVAGGCISPYTKMDPADRPWYAEDRYRFASEMPVTSKDEGFRKVEAYWETIEAIRSVPDKSAQLTLDGQTMDRDAARDVVRKRIKETEKAADITSADYCGRACLWTAMIPVKIAVTPIEAVQILVESPVTNIE